MPLREPVKTSILPQMKYSATTVISLSQPYAITSGSSLYSPRSYADGSFVLAYLGDDRTGFRLELTWLRDHAGRAYELGENESHLCLRVEGDYDAVREYHRSRGWVCYENHDMGLYFINDPDDYWIEVLPVK